MIKLRCGPKMHGILAGNVIEIACNSTYCGASKEVMVIHRFDTTSGQLLETLKYKKVSD